MFGFLAMICLYSAVIFPVMMLGICYPFSKKLALFWSNYITDHTARLVFAILKTYRGFNFLGDKKSKEQLPERFMIISNHQSLLDIVVYFKFFLKRGVRFVAKDNLAKTPMVGKMLKSQQHCMIPRKGSPAVAMKRIEEFGNRVMEKNQIPLIFPEGTRSRDGNLGQFYAAGFRRLVETVKIPVAVCALDGGWKLRDLRKISTQMKRGSYRVKVLKVYPAPQTKEDEKKILEEAPGLIQAQLDYWRSLPKYSKEV